MSEGQRDAEFQRIRQDLDDLQALVHVISEVNSSLDLRQILQTSLEGIRQVVGGEFGGVILISPNGKVELAYNIALPSDLRALLENLSIHLEPSQSPRPPEEPTSILALVGKQVSDALRACSVGFLVMPLSVRAEAIGILFVGAPAKEILNPPSVNLLMSIGEQVGRAIENARLHAKLRESEEWHRAFIENSLAAFWEGDADGRILFVNNAVCRMIGLERDVILGMHVRDFFIYDDELRRAARKALEENGVWVNPHVHLRTADGQIKDVSVTTRAVRDHAGKFVRYQTVLHDVTEQEHLLETLRQRNEELAALNEIANILSNPLNIERALDQICEQIVSLTRMDSVGLYLSDESRQFLNLLAQRGIPEALLAPAQRLGLDDPATYAVAVEGKTIAFNDVSEFHVLESFAGPRAEGYHAGICVPIQKRGASVGAIFVGSKTKTQYEQSDVNLILNIGRQIGAALENAELYAQMQRRVDELNGLAELSAACVATLDPQALTAIAVEWTKKLLHVDGCGIRVLEGGVLRLGAAHLAKAGMHPEQQIEMDDMTRLIVEKHAPLIVDDIDADSSISLAQRQNTKTFGIHSIAGVPLPARERTIGILTVGNTQPHHWSQQEIELLKTIANQVANAIDNAQLFQNVLSEQRKVQAIFDSGLSGLFATDAEGCIVMFNRAAERMTGWTQSETYGKKWQELFSDPSQDSSAESLIDEALLRKKTAFVQEGREIRTRDGRVIPVAQAVAPLLDEKGSVTGAVGAFWDLSREQAAELSYAEFLRMVAHELRSPLTALLGALQVLERPTLSKERRTEMWAVVKNDAERLKRFAREFLDHEALLKSETQLRLAPLEIVSIARTLAYKFRVTDKDKHHFRIQSAKPEPMVSADRDQVEHVLGNLLDNAINYSPAGSVITISMKPLEDNMVDIAVSDQGHGLPVSEHAKIFKPFYRAPHKEGRRVYGHGLGLFIAQNMVKEMGGNIWVESQEGQGATFHFTLRRYR